MGTLFLITGGRKKTLGLPTRSSQGPRGSAVQPVTGVDLTRSKKPTTSTRGKMGSPSPGAEAHPITLNRDSDVVAARDSLVLKGT